MSRLRSEQRPLTGNKTLDDSHAEIFEMCEDVVRAYSDEEQRGALKRMLAALTDYCTWHMAQEEKGMRSCGYPRLDAHRAHHYRIQEEFAPLIGPVLRYEVQVERISEIFQKLFADHVETWDADFAEFIRDNGVVLPEA